MTTTRSESSKNSRAKPVAAATTAADAIALLKADHRRVEKLFAEFEEASRADRKLRIATQICDELTVHAELEEKAFYPKAREAMEETDLIDEATVEHASAKWLIEQIRGMTPEDDLYDAKIKVLEEYIQHHVKEEENEIFPTLKKTDLDLAALGEELQALKPKLEKKLIKH